jgi:hypothetical protein
MIYILRRVRRYQREVIRILISKKNRQHNGQKIPKGGNQNPYLEEEYNGQKKKYKRTNNDL